MITVNLKNLYPWIAEDEYIEITEEMYEAMKAADRQENNYEKRTRYHKAFYSLDYADWMENYTAKKVPSPEEIYENEVLIDELYEAIEALPEIQRRRVCACYLDGLRKAEIARKEGVSDSSTSKSLDNAFKHLEVALKKYFPDEG